MLFSAAVTRTVTKSLRLLYADALLQRSKFSFNAGICTYLCYLIQSAQETFVQNQLSPAVMVISAKYEKCFNGSYRTLKFEQASFEVSQILSTVYVKYIFLTLL